MSEILLKRGTKSAISNYTGKDGELVVDIENNDLYLMNSDQKGGVVLAKKSDIPTVPTKTSQLTNDSGFITSASVPNNIKAYVTTFSGSNTSWYKLYSNGWIEQGGRIAHSSDTSAMVVTFPKAMTKSQYVALASSEYGSSSGNGWDYCHSKTTTGMKVVASEPGTSWYVCGF